MITEGVVALIWAAAAAYFFGPDSVVDVTGKSGVAIVGIIANTWFTPAIAVITILGVISAAVTSGDTALRSARLIIADFLHYDQKPIKNRLIVAIPMFVVTAVVLVYSIADTSGFDMIWRYFAWANQVIAMVTLWAGTACLQPEVRGIQHPYFRDGRPSYRRRRSFSSVRCKCGQTGSHPAGARRPRHV